MTSQGDELKTKNEEKADQKLFQVIGNCWTRLRVWKNWLCDPEGPSPISLLKNIFFRWVLGVAVFLFGLSILVLTIPYADQFFSVSLICYPLSSNSGIDFFRYLGFGLLLAGATFYVIGSHPRKIELKTAVFNEEIDNVVREIRTKLIRSASQPLQDNIDDEIEKLQILKEMPTEVSFLRLIALRKLHIDLCDEYEELKAFAESDIGDYEIYVGDDNRKFIMYRNAFDTLYRDHARIFNTNAAENQIPLVVTELKTHIKELRDEIQWEKFSAGQGEAIVKSFTYWSMAAIFSLLMLGITPLIHTPLLLTELTLVHWGLLGMTGAVIYTASTIRAKDPSDLGFEEGNYELRKMLLGIVIGGISAILLYAAIRSGVFGGKILPKFDYDGNEVLLDSEIIRNNLLAIFWAILAGYSAKLSDRLLGGSEKALST